MKLKILILIIGIIIGTVFLVTAIRNEIPVSYEFKPIEQIVIGDVGDTLLRAKHNPTVEFDNNITDTGHGVSDDMEIIKYNGVYSGVTVGATVFDYFDDDASVNDAIYFGWDRSVWHNLMLNVGTQLVADSITIAWEYYKTDNTWGALTVTDNTNSFQNAGFNIVEFDVSDHWRFSPNLAGIAAADGYYIRARITAVTSITEGGANAVDELDANDYAIKIYGLAARLSDIAIADDSNGWGMVTNESFHYYRIKCNFIIGKSGETTEFTIKDGEILEVGESIPDPYPSWFYSGKRIILAQQSGDKFTLGETSGGDYFDGGMLIYNSCQGLISPYNTWYCDFYCYSSTVRKLRGSFGDFVFGAGEHKIINSILEIDRAYFSSGIGSREFKNVLLEGTSAAHEPFYIYASNTVVDNLMFGRGKGIVVGRNIVLENIDFGATRILKAGYQATDMTALNCDFDDLATQTNPSAAGLAINVNYTVELTALDESGGVVTNNNIRIVNSQGAILTNSIYTTGISVTTYYATFDSGDTNYNPMEIWVSKDGYETIYQKINITNENRKLTVKMRHSPTSGRDHMGSPIR